MRSYFRFPKVAEKEIRELLDHDPGEFYDAAIRALTPLDDAPASRYLIVLLLERLLLLRMLADPAVDLEHAASLARVAVLQNQQADVLLAKALASTAKAGSEIPVPGLLRVLKILEDIADEHRITPCLLSLVRHPDPHLRSKVVLMVGRCGRNLQWIERQMKDTDPRTRANALQALWGVDTDHARELLRAAALDPNNRVAGNALLGLYRIGDTAAIRNLLAMAEKDASLFRATAAWVMGETGDARFRDALQLLSKNPDRSVRNRAAGAVQLVEAKAQTHPRSDWKIDAIPEAGLWMSRTRSIQVALRTGDGSEPPLVLPTEFYVAEDGNAVLDYRVEICDIPESVAFTFLIPLMPVMEGETVRPFVPGALNALEWKRPQDVCAAVAYRPPRRWCLRATFVGEIIEIAPPDPKELEIAPPDFTTDAASARHALQNPVPELAHACLWDAILHTVDTLKLAAAGAPVPHLVVYVPYEAEAPLERHEPLLAALDASVPIHCITEVENPRLAALCQRTGGTCTVCESQDEVTHAVERSCVSRIARYKLHYESIKRASAIEITVYPSGGWASTVVKLSH